jgi:CheY-like chemotaxis protein
MHILVVDDHRDTVWIYRKLLTHWGHQVTEATNCVAALRAMRAERLDLLLCDIVLPVGDGYEILAGAREIYPIKAIAITGHGMPEDIERILAAGFDDYILKPVVLDKLRTVVEGFHQKFLLDPNGDRQSNPFMAG